MFLRWHFPSHKVVVYELGQKVRDTWIYDLNVESDPFGLKHSRTIIQRNFEKIYSLARICDVPDLYLKCLNLVSKDLKAIEKTEFGKFLQDHDPWFELEILRFLNEVEWRQKQKHMEKEWCHPFSYRIYVVDDDISYWEENEVSPSLIIGGMRDVAKTDLLLGIEANRGDYSKKLQQLLALYNLLFAKAFGLPPPD
ncbi:hypothetical protein NE237_023181 [Protea cynaroides]|uniref:Uncharacterized protein n=1 Tax=Protea cynaroides TaxID=273540 RepID=A0A9Q0K563_9MAGN|nr:hypothetical protein NE237_023181 [Protea cynaroides]